MASIAVDTICPKHGSTVTIIGGTMSSRPDWSTGTGSAVAGPASAPSTCTITLSWFTTLGFATVSLPPFSFVGAGTFLSFAGFAGLPLPATNQMGVFTPYEYGEIRLHLTTNGGFVIGNTYSRGAFMDGTTNNFAPILYTYRTS